MTDTFLGKIGLTTCGKESLWLILAWRGEHC